MMVRAKSVGWAKRSVPTARKRGPEWWARFALPTLRTAAIESSGLLRSQ